jgi:hypothetical protein
LLWIVQEVVRVLAKRFRAVCIRERRAIGVPRRDGHGQGYHFGGPEPLRGCSSRWSRQTPVHRADHAFPLRSTSASVKTLRRGKERPRSAWRWSWCDDDGVAGAIFLSAFSQWGLTSCWETGGQRKGCVGKGDVGADESAWLAGCTLGSFASHEATCPAVSAAASPSRSGAPIKTRCAESSPKVHG